MSHLNIANVGNLYVTLLHN